MRKLGLGKKENYTFLTWINTFKFYAKESISKKYILRFLKRFITVNLLRIAYAILIIEIAK
jgi:hypothetical protein